MMIGTLPSPARADTGRRDARDAVGAPDVHAAGPSATGTPMTMLFSDIRGFTPLTEHLGPVETAALLKDYFALLVECVDRHGGRAETIFGDSMLATFGRDAADDGANAAVDAAIAMRVGLAAWNRQRRARRRPRVDMGIGINTGDVLYQTLGFPAGAAPTPIGTGVNLAARLEAACKPYAAKILISGATFCRLAGPYTSRLVDTAVLPGTRRPTEIHEILDYHTDETFPNLAEAIGSFRDGVAFYQRQRFKDAIRAFRCALSFNPRDLLARQYIARCQRLLQSPPGIDWSAISLPA